MEAGAASEVQPDWILHPTSLAAAKLAVLREKPFGSWSISHAAMNDERVPNLIESLHQSEATLTELDLSFNKLTDQGALLLCETLAREGMCGFALTLLRLGANRISDKVQAYATELLKKKRPDLVLDFEPTLRDPKPLLQVGKVFPESPASVAGLAKGDAIVAIGNYNFPGPEPKRGFKSEAERHMDSIQWFRGVAESLKPLVLERAEGGEIDVVVQRGAGKFAALTLRPAKWSGEGLIGAKIGAWPT
jgi:hypothetical protein